MRILYLILSINFFVACTSPYTITLNDNILYSPNPDNSDKLVADPNLQGCLNQIFISSGNSDLENIRLLACPGAGIQSLAGIEKLSNLEQLDLSDNSISSLEPLSRLINLRVLSMRNNDIRSISPLLPLPILRFVSLQGNNNIFCRQLNEMAKKIGNLLNRPLSCH